MLGCSSENMHGHKHECMSRSCFQPMDANCLCNRRRQPALGPPGPLSCPLKYKRGQRGARAKFGDFLEFPVLKAVLRGDARGGIMARSGVTADIKRPCRPLLCKQHMSLCHVLDECLRGPKKCPEAAGTCSDGAASSNVLSLRVAYLQLDRMANEELTCLAKSPHCWESTCRSPAPACFSVLAHLPA